MDTGQLQLCGRVCECDIPVTRLFFLSVCFVLVLMVCSSLFADDVLCFPPFNAPAYSTYTFLKYYYCHVYTLLTFVPYSTRIIFRARDRLVMSRFVIIAQLRDVDWVDLNQFVSQAVKSPICISMSGVAPKVQL